MLIHLRFFFIPTSIHSKLFKFIKKSINSLTRARDSYLSNSLKIALSLKVLFHFDRIATERKGWRKHEIKNAKVNARGKNYCRKISISNIESGSQIFSLRVAAAAFISVAAHGNFLSRSFFLSCCLYTSRHVSVLLRSTWSKSLRRFFSRTSH